MSQTEGLYKIFPWNIVESGWNAEKNRASGSIFSLGNGRFGHRANFEEEYSGDTLQGHYVGGVYYPDRTKVGWWKNGYPETFAKVLNATNWSKIDVKINGISLDLHNATNIFEFERNLNMQNALLTRSFRVEVEPGVEVKILSERFCSMASPNRALIRYSIESVSGIKRIQISPAVDADVNNEDTNWDEKFWQFNRASVTKVDSACVVNTTEKTAFKVATAFASRLEIDGLEVPSNGAFKREKLAGVVYDVTPKTGQKVVLLKHVGLVSSLNHMEEDVELLAQNEAHLGRENGFETEYNAHCAEWANIWRNGDIEIEGDESAQQAIRFNIFHLNATYRGDDPQLNIGPKGFTGEKYGGATYWDTEAYCLPFYLNTHDDSVARQLLVYRFNHLEQAISNAKKLGFNHGAALYPMVTMNGEECHNEWEITFEEIHRNGAIAYAIFNYVRHTGDDRYLVDMGFDVLLGIARFWSQRATFSESRKKWMILGVTGPNEYENNVNNNWYTNYIACWCMNYAIEVGEWLSENHSNVFATKCVAWDLDSKVEFKEWKKRIESMHLPSLEGSNVFLQQDGFMDKEQLFACDLPSSDRPINQNWSWDRILRSVFIKQADVLQGLYFFVDHFSREQLEDNFDFYEPRTVHESSLSPCVHSVLAAKLGKTDKAYEMYLRTSRLDLDDYNKEIHEGLHITSMAGTWMSVVEGFGGFSVLNGVPHFSTVLPKEWKSYAFRILFRGRLLRVTVNKKDSNVLLESGSDLIVVLNDKEIGLTVIDS